MCSNHELIPLKKAFPELIKLIRIPYSQKIWRPLASTSENEIILADFNLADFNLADSRAHAPCAFEGQFHRTIWSAAYEGIIFPIVFGLQPSVRESPALKEKSKTSLDGSVRGRSRSDSSERYVAYFRLSGATDDWVPS